MTPTSRPAKIEPAVETGDIRLDEPISVALIEDDDGDALLVQEMLDESPERIDLSWARSLAEAAPLLATADCVLLDLGLPDAMGLGGLQRIRAESKPPPVIVLTGHHDERLAVSAVAAGAQDYLIKDEVDGHQLARTIRYALQRRHAEDMESALLEARLRAQENTRLERGLVPNPQIADSDLTVATRYAAGGGRMLLGGDFYDVVQDATGALRAIIGDVAGHGPDQAALGVALRIAWRTLVLAGISDADILPIIDRVLVDERHDDTHFTTACTLTIHAGRQTAELCVAGHPMPLLRADGRWTALRHSGGPALGLFATARWVPATVELPDGPWDVLLYTDGVVEGHVGAGPERLDVEGLLGLLNAGYPDGAAAGDASATIERLAAEVERLNQAPLTDDTAMVLIANKRPAGLGRP